MELGLSWTFNSTARQLAQGSTGAREQGPSEFYDKTRNSEKEQNYFEDLTWNPEWK